MSPSPRSNDTTNNMIMKPYYKYSLGEVFEFRHEPDKYWLAVVIYSFDQLYLFKWLGDYGEFWHDSTLDNQEESEDQPWSRSIATQRLYKPGHHMQFFLESQCKLERPTTFLITPSAYNPAEDPYGNITTVEDLLALDIKTNDKINNESSQTKQDQLSRSPKANNLIREKLDNIIDAVINELEGDKNLDEPQNLSTSVDSNDQDNSVNCSQLKIKDNDDCTKAETLPTSGHGPEQALSHFSGKQESTDNDFLGDNKNNLTSPNKYPKINQIDKKEKEEDVVIDSNGIVSQIGRLESLGVDFDDRKKQLEEQHSSALKRGWRISADDWARVNTVGVTVRLNNKIASDQFKNYKDIKDLCKIIQFQSLFAVYQSPLNGEIIRLAEHRDISNEFFDLSLLNDDNKMQIEYERIVSQDPNFIKIYFNHKCFNGPSLSKSKICSLPQYVGPGPLKLVLEEVVTKIISVAYVPPRILNDLSSPSFLKLLVQRELSDIDHMEFKAKYQKRVQRELVPVCLGIEHLAAYCECLCEHLKCCYNLFGPNLYDGDDCPGHCRVLTKSNKFMKRATYYRDKARNGEFLGNEQGGGSGSSNSSSSRKQTLNNSNTIRARQNASKGGKNFRQNQEESP